GPGPRCLGAGPSSVRSARPARILLAVGGVPNVCPGWVATAPNTPSNTTRPRRYKPATGTCSSGSVRQPNPSGRPPTPVCTRPRPTTTCWPTCGHKLRADCLPGTSGPAADPEPRSGPTAGVEPTHPGGPVFYSPTHPPSSVTGHSPGVVGTGELIFWQLLLQQASAPHPGVTPTETFIRCRGRKLQDLPLPRYSSTGMGETPSSIRTLYVIPCRWSTSCATRRARASVNTVMAVEPSGLVCSTTIRRGRGTSPRTSKKLKQPSYWESVVPDSLMIVGLSRTTAVAPRPLERQRGPRD